MYLTNENGLTSPEIFEGYVHSELLLSCYFSETTVDVEDLYLFLLQELFPRSPS